MLIFLACWKPRVSDISIVATVNNSHVCEAYLLSYDRFPMLQFQQYLLMQPLQLTTSLITQWTMQYKGS